MNIAMVVAWDLDVSMLDASSPTGVTPEGHSRLMETAYALDVDAVYELGSGVMVTAMAECSHPSERVDGEYLRCGVCGIIIGRS